MTISDKLVPKKSLRTEFPKEPVPPVIKRVLFFSVISAIFVG
jgi:hypothetical protein